MWIKGILSKAAWSYKILEGFRYIRLRDKAFVLMYHRVIRSLAEESVFTQPGMYVLASTFRQQAAFLKERFHVIPLNELVGRIENGQNVGGCCALTFDDGWHDNFSNAFPVLQEFELPATIFLATGFIGTNKIFWPEELSIYMGQPNVKFSERQNLVLNRFLNQVTNNRKDLAFLDNAIMVLKAWAPQEREELFQLLRSKNPNPFIGRLLLNWDEARVMRDSGLVSFGAHTANHVILDQVSPLQAEKEIILSKQEVEKHLGICSNCFSFPNGNFNNVLQSILKRTGFKSAVTTRRGWVGLKSPLLEIPRIGMHEDVSQTIPLFFARILLRCF